jgi:hypothetical protein
MIIIPDWVKQHAPALAVAGVLVFGGRFALMEHDARLKADAAVASAEASVKSLQSQQATVTKQASTRVIVLQQKAAEVDTPAKAISALPEAAPEIEPIALPDEPERVSVKAEPLYQDLNQAAQDKVELKACSDNLALQKQIDQEKDLEVKAEKKKPGFFHRLGKGLAVVGCSAAGGALGGLSKSAAGPAIGAAAGAGLCQMF